MHGLMREGRRKPVLYSTLLLNAANWFPYRTEGADVGRFCPLGTQLAAAGIAAFVFL